ncbi:hypothetical protein cyc_08818 [Cyclospora cayetanensis]|uniref:Uncharacterized protein n=1 Tax=Cyclospora cayetanensis TaxID=88456 RepID=A0A1D3DAX1_9EIME|nr:hypothetical protein cyc_08818 [Cyclospora cayetanensis]
MRAKEKKKGKGGASARGDTFVAAEKEGVEAGNGGKEENQAEKRLHAPRKYQGEGQGTIHFLSRAKKGGRGACAATKRRATFSGCPHSAVSKCLPHGGTREGETVGDFLSLAAQGSRLKALLGACVSEE